MKIMNVKFNEEEANKNISLILKQQKEEESKMLKRIRKEDRPRRWHH